MFDLPVGAGPGDDGIVKGAESGCAATAMSPEGGAKPGGSAIFGRTRFAWVRIAILLTLIYDVNCRTI